MILPLKKLIIPKDWKTCKNDFLDLEPDNELPISEVNIYFDEDILLLTQGEYFIDLGFYGGNYSIDRSGFFRLIVAKGDFGKGYLYENFITRSTNEVKTRVELYASLISNRNIFSLQNIMYGSEIDINYYLYSSYHGLKVRANSKIYKAVEKPAYKRD